MDCRRRLRADLREIVKLLILRAPVPVEPADLIVLAIGIVVAPLGASEFVAGRRLPKAKVPARFHAQSKRIRGVSPH